GGQTFQADGIGLEVPAGWTATPSTILLHYESIAGFIGGGGGTGSVACASAYIPGAGGTCTTTVNLPSGGAVVQVSAWAGPPMPNTPAATVLAADPTATALTVAGSAAALETIAGGEHGADLTLRWTIDWPGSEFASARLTAWFKGPNVENNRAAVESMVASLTLVTP
ncbi:MAG: hypothetical protein WCK58_15570, partial [Chloroflexota bacterium]